jgi:DNA repair protein RadC
VKFDEVWKTVAAYLKAIAELNSRAACEEIKSREAISAWTALVEYVRRESQHETREQFRVLFLGRKNQLITDEIMGRGTIDHAPLYPREIARRALEIQCASLFLVHNHPSGDPKPSRADFDTTREIIDVLQPFDITVHDHLIVGTAGVVSFRSSGLN